MTPCVVECSGFQWAKDSRGGAVLRWWGSPKASDKGKTTRGLALPTYAGAEALGAAMEGWAYPYPVQILQFSLERRQVRMAYMDVQPAQPNGKTVLLIYGKNFGSNY